MSDVQTYRHVGFTLRLGLAILPILFFWLLLRPSYSPGVRVAGAIYLVLWMMYVASLYYHYLRA